MASPCSFCVSLVIASAPYYREARVTVVGRQTAYRMRHCCARRIDKTGGRRKLLRTSTRWAERQRIVGAEANRIAVPTRLCRAQASPFRRHRSHSSPRLPINPFLLGVKGGYSLSSEREYPPYSLPCGYAGNVVQRRRRCYFSAHGADFTPFPMKSLRASAALAAPARQQHPCRVRHCRRAAWRAGTRAVSCRAGSS